MCKKKIIEKKNISIFESKMKRPRQKKKIECKTKTHYKINHVAANALWVVSSSAAPIKQTNNNFILHHISQFGRINVNRMRERK